MAEQLVDDSRPSVSPDHQNKQETRQETMPQPPRRQLSTKPEKSPKMPEASQEREKVEEVKQVEQTEERQEPDGRQADTSVTEHERTEVRVL